VWNPQLRFPNGNELPMGVNAGAACCEIELVWNRENALTAIEVLCEQCMY